MSSTPNTNMENNTKSVIFVTLKDGEYDDRWIEDLNPLLENDDILGHRTLHWCGQRKKNARDNVVGPGTLVAVRENSNQLKFTIVGEVAEKTLLTPHKEKVPATYNLLIEMYRSPRTIPRKTGDRCVHWSVMRELGFQPPHSFLPEGIYSA